MRTGEGEKEQTKPDFPVLILQSDDKGSGGETKARMKEISLALLAICGLALALQDEERKPSGGTINDLFTNEETVFRSPVSLFWN